MLWSLDDVRMYSACGTCDVVCCSMLQCNSRLQRCSAAAFLCCSVAVLNCRSRRAPRRSGPWKDANVNCVCGTCGMLQCCRIAVMQCCGRPTPVYTHLCILACMYVTYASLYYFLFMHMNILLHTCAFRYLYRHVCCKHAPYLYKYGDVSS